MDIKILVLLILFTPLIGFLINGLSFKNKSSPISGAIATASILVSFVATVVLWQKMLLLGHERRVVEVILYKWLEVGDFSAQFGVLLDPISLTMLLVITGVGTLIHLFSVGYMSHDDTPARYFAYLNLFVFNMLLLVLGNNLLLMFVGWEGVGLCSYLLIGYWFKDSEKAAAGMKAFITNRIGDAGFLLGIFVLFMTFGTTSFQELWSYVPKVAELGWNGPVTVACLLLFVGAMGKSAQIPLYVWLPDAMAGPTPVSALIHAATMVTAGVYMIVRLNPLFLVAPNAMLVVAWIGGLTALMAATIAVTQNDIKKVLAYSTVSQLGYMFMACGVGAFGAAMFHLVTHAFFKALMFLGSGSVIHAMHEEQDIRKMGGLKDKLPITHFTFLCGWLAIIGCPPFAGFFSKDEILWFTFHSPQGSKILWVIGVLGAALTAFYMTRLMFLTFWGKSRVPKEIHPHESPVLMTVPLIVLAILSVVGGWMGVPEVFNHFPGVSHIPNIFEEWLHSRILPIPNITEAHPGQELAVMGLSLSIVAGSVLFAIYCYGIKTDLPKRITDRFAGVYNTVLNKYWVDEFYFAGIINPLVETSKGLWLYIDVNFIDKTTYVLSDVVRGAGSFCRSMQNGNLQYYAFYIVIGLVGALIFCAQL